MNSRIMINMANKFVFFESEKIYKEFDNIYKSRSIY